MVSCTVEALRRYRETDKVPRQWTWFHFIVLQPNPVALAAGFFVRTLETSDSESTEGKTMKMIYDVNQKPPLAKNLIYAFQQVLAIMAATLLVPMLVNLNSGTTYMSQPAALCGAGFGTLFYIYVTKKRSPVFLGSSFAFISPLIGATAFGYLGIFVGAIFAGLVYTIIALIIKKTGSGWVNKLLPPVVIGPTVSLIGLSLSTSAISNLTNTASSVANYNILHILVGVFAFLVTIWASIKGPKWMRMIPFIIGIGAAYIVGLILTFCGLPIINVAAFDNMQFFKLPEFTFLGMFSGKGDTIKSFSDVLNLFMLFAPVAFVTLAEHIADHKNLSSIVGRDLITDPGLDRTLIGDGIGSIIGSFFGGCPNTTYGESVGCVAITGNASVSTIVLTAFYCIILSFLDPFTCFVNSIPTCIVGGVCIALYGFIAVSGLKMVQDVDLGDNRNLFVVAAILVCGIGGLELKLGPITISAIASALILGIIVNVLFNRRNEKSAQ